MRISKALVFPALMVALLAATLAVGPVIGSAQQFTKPGVVPPTGCRDGGVVSFEQFTTTGFSLVKTGQPNDTVVAGAWVVADNQQPSTGVVQATNCGTPGVVDGNSLNLMGVRITPTITSASEADIQEVKLVHDVNLNGQYEPLLDQVIQTKPGSELDSGNGAVFFNGAQSPLFNLTNPGFGVPCGTGLIVGGTRCGVGLLAVAEIGGAPTTGTQFGLELHALAGDVPGANAPSPATAVSSGFNSALNPQGSNVRVQFTGGQPGSATPVSHISNASGNPETGVRQIDLTGLKTRFRKDTITPGTREVIAGTLALCDGGEVASTQAQILPSIATAPPSIAGGTGSIPCVPSGGTDGNATGINGATLVFSGELAQYMGTVRMYVDELAGGGYAGTGGGNGTLFETGELTQQATPRYNEATGEAIVTFGGKQGAILNTGNGTPVAASVDAGGTPTVIVFTVDVDSNAPSGEVNVDIGLQSFDDTAQAGTFGTNPCAALASGPCASNFLNSGPAETSFQVEAAGNGGQQPATGVAQYDNNGNGVIDDNEFMTAIDDWIAASIQDSLFFDVLNAWVEQTSVSSSAVSGLSLGNVALSSTNSGTTFAVSGQGVESTRVTVFSLDGSTVFRQETAGNTLSWNHTASNGQPVANGVYLYRVTVEGANGQITSDVKKLVVTR